MTTNTKHTPGPWIHTGNTIYAASDTAIAHPIATVKCGPSMPNCMDNAKMLAAAPGLYAALRACAEYLACIPETAAGGDDEALLLTRMALATLAKVEG